MPLAVLPQSPPNVKGPNCVLASTPTQARARPPSGVVGSSSLRSGSASSHASVAAWSFEPLTLNVPSGPSHARAPLS